jgi:uncharacterized protein
MMKIDSQAPLLDLFKLLRSPLKLTIDQYYLLISALGTDFDWNNWAKLKRLCKLVWLKATADSEPTLVATFDCIFQNWQIECEQSIVAWFEENKSELQPANEPEPQLGLLPSSPPPRHRNNISAPTPSRKTPNPACDGDDLPIAINNTKSSFIIKQLPISEHDFKTTWRSMRRNLPDRRLEELDLDATIAKLNRQGYLDDLVMRPINSRRSNLVVLVDRHHTMIPYRPVCEPLLAAVRNKRIAPAQIYYFTGYPDEYLDEPGSMQPLALKTLLSRLHPQRTVVSIVSDGGAAGGNYSEPRIAGTQRFLQQLLPCVREVLWLNLVPEEHWEHTSAATIAQALAGRMIPFERVRWQQIAKAEQLMSEVQLWLLKAHD